MQDIQQPAAALEPAPTVAKPRMPRVVSELVEFRHVLYQLVRQQLILRYRRTFFGYLWTLFNPLLMMSTTAVVFSTIFHMDLKTYAIFLFSGVIAFNCFAASVTQSGQALIGNEGLIKKIYVPKILFPLAICIASLIDSALTSASLFLIILAIGGTLTPALLFLPVAYVLLFFMSLGFALVMAIATVYLRDLAHLVTILMQALLFLTPVYYKPESMTGKVGWLIELNPLTSFVEMFRAPIYQGMLPPLTSVLLATVFACVSVAGGLAFFLRYERHVAFRL